LWELRVADHSNKTIGGKKMKTVKVKVYSFDELSEEVKEKVLKKLYDINVNHQWWDYIYDDVKTIGDLMGISIDNIWHSGFCNQGDGACFEGVYSYEKGSVKKIKSYAPKDEELHKIANDLYQIQRRHFYQLSANVSHNGHYYHEYCTDIKVSGEHPHFAMENFRPDEETEEAISDCLRDFMRWIYNQLEEEFFYRTSQEQIIETIETFDFKFKEDGTFF
jgi:hypothetical protein